MKKEFWQEKWQNQQTGFHKDFTHPLLIEFINELDIVVGDTIFVPLCGKTLDMLWLNTQGYKVIGVEVSKLAVTQFFAENDLTYKHTSAEKFNIYNYENITIYQGDFFDLTSEHLKNVQAVYDRAALIALPDDMVVEYAKHMQNLLANGTNELLITLEFNKTSGSVGPPFSTTSTKVNDLFDNYSSTKLLYETDIIEREYNFQEQGCKFVYERVYLVCF